MTIIEFIAIGIGCLFMQYPAGICIAEESTAPAAAIQVAVPEFTGTSVDVILSAESVFVWDIETGTVLYEKEADTKRPVASLSKLLSGLAVRSLLAPSAIVEIPPEARRVQSLGAHIRLPIGEHASVRDLLTASMVPSANDAMLTLAIAAKGSEAAFVEYANEYAKGLGLEHTQIANATGLSGGTQFSTAREAGAMLYQAHQDEQLRPMLAQEKDTLITQEGTSRLYYTTNKLLGTYMPVIAAKTGYTHEAGENLAIITQNQQGDQVGVVVLNSKDRFQDTKALVEWIWRNYTWPN